MMDWDTAPARRLWRWCYRTPLWRSCWGIGASTVRRMPLKCPTSSGGQGSSRHLSSTQAGCSPPEPTTLLFDIAPDHERHRGTTRLRGPRVRILIGDGSAGATGNLSHLPLPVPEGG